MDDIIEIEATMLEDKKLYMQLLQENISRMNQNCMQCKAWCAAIDAALLAVANTNVNLLWIAIGITFCAYLLDSSYLRLEKNYRCFFKSVVNYQNNTSDISVNLFCFDVEDFNDKDSSTTMKSVNRDNWWKALFSWSTYMVYAIMIILLEIVILILE